ncbi:HNH endonuclease family protein [Streptomyces sp. NBC_01477]|uniref:HNH endonuclease family protein n=1 Tax=Streptomyces sp. NBC_01477 TaxID=2976015 RepID=UPI002E33A768|nr:HNH endonuclease family protein [Streptomyces sp. NBC_01477]
MGRQVDVMARAVAAAAVSVLILGVAGCQPKDVTDGAAPSGQDTAAGSGGGGSAASELAELKVKPDGSISSYDRVKDFGEAWTDQQGAPGGHNHCETRDDILRRDLISVKLDGKCEVESGRLHDPYTGKTIDFTRGRGTSLTVQIDHVVSLGNAWQTGASALPQATREELANDPLNLIAADGPANEGKGDDDASKWLPKSDGFRCTYVARQIAVKAKYRLWVSTAEKAAISKVLGGCHGQALPTETSRGIALKS